VRTLTLEISVESSLIPLLEIVGSPLTSTTGTIRLRYHEVEKVTSAVDGTTEEYELRKASNADVNFFEADCVL
jgi:hypothetical protein